MTEDFIGLYVFTFVIAGMVAYAGTEETLKVFEYLGLQIKYQWVMIRMAVMRYKLKRQLDKTVKAYEKDLEKINDKRKQELF